MTIAVQKHSIWCYAWTHVSSCVVLRSLRMSSVQLQSESTAVPRLLGRGRGVFASGTKVCGQGWFMFFGLNDLFVILARGVRGR
jgi:hypothetical protein